MRAFGRQQGAALIVTLIMLMAITLLAMTAINTSTISLRVTDNVRTVQEQEAALAQGIEIFVSDPQHFHAEQGWQGEIDGMQVAIEEPRCIYSRPSAGSADREGVEDVESPEQTYWEFRARIDGLDTGTSPSMSKGVRMRMLADPERC